MSPKDARLFGKGGLLKIFGVFLLSLACSFAQSAVPLGAAATFAVLASSTVTNTGATVTAGNVGVSPGTAITGFPPGIVTPPAALHSADTAAANAQTALTTAYNTAAGEASTQNLTGQNLGGLTLGPGVYTFNTSAQLTGTLTLTGAGFYIFQIGSTLTTASSSVVAAINGADAANVFWQVGSSATLGTGSAFIGNILAEISITATTGAAIAGRLLALTGAVTLDTNTITYPPAIPPGGPGGGPLPATPVPASWILVLIGLVCAALYRTRERWLRRFKNS
jgi:type VI secretion system secreted protein VgrG